jgi:rare lipoprotein A
MTVATNVCALFLAIVCVACTSSPRFVIKEKAEEATVDAAYVQEGVASYYADEFHGRTTSNGETFDMNELTAAHQTLPFGTIVKVINKQNGRSVTVRINDRGPFLKDRIIDLSRAAAEKIGMIGPGTAEVRLEILQLGSTN